jgi:hypothetical protein
MFNPVAGFPYALLPNWIILSEFDMIGSKNFGHRSYKVQCSLQDLVLKEN